MIKTRRKSRAITAPGIPDKPYFKIGEVAQLCGVKPYVLRYWETEFGSLKPQKSRSGQRLYRRVDVELVLRIKQLLYAERFTIEGARSALRAQGENGAANVAREQRKSPQVPQLDPQTLKELRQGVIDLLALVDQ